MEYENWEDFINGGQIGYNGHSGNVGYSMKKNCAHNEIKLAYGGGGIVRGLSGDVHEAKLSELPGLNVFLASWALPEIYMYSNCYSDLIQEPPKNRIIYFPVADQHAPASKAEFALLMDVLLKEVNGGGQVNVSCVGGHGRTGLILAVLQGLLLGSKTPIQDIRSTYCKKAVESYAQECFIHDWLGLERPKEVVKLCGKCKKNEQELKPSGLRDVWCGPCNRVWEAEQAERRKADEAKAKGSASSPPPAIIPFRGHSTAVGSGGGVGGPGVKCRKCWVRNPQDGSLWCLTCSFDLEPKDLPHEKPEGWSKKTWKRLLKAVQGHAHAPGVSAEIIGSIPPLVAKQPPIDKALLVAALSQADLDRHAMLKEKPIHQMTEVEWHDFLRFEFGEETAKKGANV